MEVGKLKNEVLGEIVLSEIQSIREDVLIRPGVGEDCAAIAYGDFACVLTTDPITGSGSQLGKLAVHVCLNDIASSGAEPVGLLLTLLCPEGTSKDEIQGILREANQTANLMGIEIVGGHTEITTAVNRTIVSATAIGKTMIDTLIKTSGAKSGDYIYLTKQVATEGTAIIAYEKADELSTVLTREELAQAQSLMDQISVVEEGRIAAKVGATAMHDATEGGVLGAIHELCEASGKGCHIYHHKLKLLSVTEKICSYYNIDPYRLISSGTMVITINPDLAGLLEREFLSAGIEYEWVGEITSELEKVLIIGETPEEQIFESIESPDSDELYKIIK